MESQGENNQTKEPRIPGLIKLALLLVIPTILCAAAFSLYLYGRIIYTPPPSTVRIQIDVSDSLNEVKIESLTFTPIYENGEGEFEKLYESPVVLLLKNHSDKEKFVGVVYSTNSGKVSNYFPGATMDTELIAIEPSFEGEKAVKMRHPRFVSGGHVRFTIGTFLGPRVRPEEFVPMHEFEAIIVSE